MLRSVFTKTLWDQRREIAGWALGIAAIGVMYAVFYPSVNNPQMAAALEAYPEGLLDAMGFTDVTSPAGYLGSTTYGIMGPILMIIFGTALGGRAIAGEEEAGRLDLLLAHPVERWRVVMERAGALVAALALAGLTLLVAILAASGPGEYGAIGVGNLVATSVQLVLLGVTFGLLALTAGAVTGKRSVATIAVANVAIPAYFANTIGPTIEAIAWTRHLSPFYYYSGGQPLVYGWQGLDMLVLVAASAVILAIGVAGFARRDVAT